MINNLDKIANVYSDVLPVIEQAEKIELTAFMRLLNIRMNNPQSYITIVGETGSGKSTIINGMLRQTILPTSAKPTTGSVTHIIFTEPDMNQFFAINKDGSQESLSYNLFLKLATTPDDKLLRLQIRTKSPLSIYNGLNIFDTPGFNSIHVEHEEVLREFIPESDMIIFVVNYRTGFGQDDQDLMEIIFELTKNDENIPLVLVINRVPENIDYSSSRIIEIKNNVNDSLHREVNIFLIPSYPYEDKNGQHLNVLPKVNDIVNEIKNIVDDPIRNKMIIDKLGIALTQVIEETDKIFQLKEEVFHLNDSDIENLKSELEKYRSHEQDSIILIDECILRLQRTLPKLIDKYQAIMIKNLSEYIDDQNRWFNKENCMSYIEGYGLNFEIKKTAVEIENYIFSELEELNRKLEEMANTAINELNNHVNLNHSNLYKIVEKVLSRIALKWSGTAINNLLKSFGGIGGSAAGLGNLVKKIVSKSGKLIGITFKRGVYTKIGKFFTKGRMKVLGNVLSIAIDAGVFIFDVIKWRNEIKKMIKNSICDWSSEVIKQLISDDIPKIKEANITSIKEVYSLFVDEILGEINKTKSKISDEEIKQIIFNRKILKSSLQQLTN